MEVSLKTSVLIQKLIEIDKTVSFDAAVVTGEHWWPTPISRVYQVLTIANNGGFNSRQFHQS
jgi:hypothetical protein